MDKIRTKVEPNFGKLRNAKQILTSGIFTFLAFAKLRFHPSAQSFVYKSIDEAVLVGHQYFGNAVLVLNSVDVFTANPLSLQNVMVN